MQKKKLYFLLLLILELGVLLIPLSMGKVLEKIEYEDYYLGEDDRVRITISPKYYSGGNIVVVANNKLDGVWVNCIIGFDRDVLIPKDVLLYWNKTEYKRIYHTIPEVYYDEGRYNLTYSSKDDYYFYNGTLTLFEYDTDGAGEQQLVYNFNWLRKADKTLFIRVPYLLEWKSIKKDWSKLNAYYDGIDSWYVSDGFYMKGGRDYKIKIVGDLIPQWNVSPFDYKGVFSVAFKPEDMSLGEAITKKKLYYIEPDWYSELWEHRKNFTIQAQTDAGTNYPIFIEVYNITGTDSGNKVYWGDLVQDDFGDVRFVDHTGGENKSLDYYLDTIYSTYALFVMEEDDSLSVNNQTAWCYVGTSGTTVNVSSGENTFPYFEGFEETVDTEPSGWNELSGSVNDTWLIKTDQRVKDNSSLKISDDGSSLGIKIYNDDMNGLDDAVIHFWIRANDESQRSAGVFHNQDGVTDNDRIGLVIYRGDNNDWRYRDNVGYKDIPNWSAPDSDTWYRIEVYLDDVDNDVKYVKDRDEDSGFVNAIEPWTSLDYIRFEVNEAYGSDLDAWFDDVYVRKVVYPTEPAVFEWGVMENNTVINIGDINEFYGVGYNNSDDSYVNLRWNYNEVLYNVSYYEIERNGTYLNITIEQSYDDYNVSVGDFWRYRIKGVFNLSGVFYNSSWSDYYNYEKVYYSVGIDLNTVMASVIVGELFWIIVMVQIALSLLVIAYSKKGAFAFGLINWFSAIYYISVIGNSFNVWGAGFLMVFGTVDILYGFF